MPIQFTDDYSYIWSGFTLEDIENQFYWVFDVEATGIDVTTEQVTQLGGVRVAGNQTDFTSTFASYVCPNKPIPQKIQKLTGITSRQTETASKFAEVFPRFLERCRGHILVTQCGYEFDYPLLEAECQRCGLIFPDFVQLDTKAFFAFLHPELDQTFSTDFLVSYYGLDSAGLNRHDALGDALLVSLILCAELADARKQGLSSIRLARPITIKRFQLPPL
jgi:DNA polymerase-3 subunit epsilon